MKLIVKTIIITILTVFCGIVLKLDYNEVNLIENILLFLLKWLSIMPIVLFFTRFFRKL